MRVRLVASTIGAVAVAILLVPAAAGATEVTPTQVIPVQQPGDVAFDPFSAELYASSRADPPAIYKFKLRDGVTFNDGFILQPPDFDLTALDFGKDGYLYAGNDAGDTVEVINPETDQIVDTFPQPSGSGALTGFGFGYNSDALANFGTSEGGQGSVFFGQAPNYPFRIGFGPSTTFNGIDSLSGDGRIKGGKAADEFVALDSNQNVVDRFSDFPNPFEHPFDDLLRGGLGGPPNASGGFPGTDLSVSPIDTKPKQNGKGAHSLIVPVPSQGAIYREDDPTASPITWETFDAGGRPVQVDEYCDPNKTPGVGKGAATDAWTDFGANAVVIGNVDPETPNPQCDEIFDLIALGAQTGFGAFTGKSAAFIFKMAPALDTKYVKGAIGFTIALAPKQRAPRAAARAIGGPSLGRKVQSASRKVRLHAGRVKKVKVRFSRRETAAIAATLQRRHRVNGTLKIRLKSPAGEKTTVKRRIRISSR